MIFHPELSTDDVSTLSTGSVTVGRLILNNSAKVMLLDGRHRWQAMRQLHVEGDLRWSQRHIEVRLIVREDMVAISEAEGIKLNKLPKIVTAILRRDCTFMDLIKKTLNFSIASEKEYNEKFTATCTMHIMKDKIGSEFLTEMSAKS